MQNTSTSSERQTIASRKLDDISFSTQLRRSLTVGATLLGMGLGGAGHVSSAAAPEVDNNPSNGLRVPATQPTAARISEPFGGPALAIEIGDVVVIPERRQPRLSAESAARKSGDALNNGIALFEFGTAPDAPRRMQQEIACLKEKIAANINDGRPITFVAIGESIPTVLAALDAVAEEWKRLPAQDVHRLKELVHLTVICKPETFSPSALGARWGGGLGTLSVIIDARSSIRAEQGLFLENYVDNLSKNTLTKSSIIILQDTEHGAATSQPSGQPTADERSASRIRMTMDQIRVQVQIAELQISRIEVEQERNLESLGRLREAAYVLQERLRALIEYELKPLEDEYRDLLKATEAARDAANDIVKNTEQLEIRQREQSRFVEQDAASIKAIDQGLAALHKFVVEETFRQGYPPAMRELRVRTWDPTAADWDGDKILNSEERAILAKYSPVLAFDRGGEPLPVSATYFRSVSTPKPGRGGMTNFEPSTYGSNVAPRWYGRMAPIVHSPEITEAQVNACEYFAVQYYGIFMFNDAKGDDRQAESNVVAGITAGLTLGGCTVLIEGTDAYGGIGNHEGDVICLDLTVRVPRDERGNLDINKSEIIFGTYHNHGRQFFAEPGGMVFSGSHPVVFLEWGANELHPQPGGTGYRGIATNGVTTNKLTNGVFDENWLVDAHNGVWRLADLSVINLGEVYAPKGEISSSTTDDVVTYDVRAHNNPPPEVLRTLNADEIADLADAKLFLEHRGMWGNSDYKIQIKFEVLWGLHEEVIDGEHFESPRGPVQNSEGKMWMRRHIVDWKVPNLPLQPLATYHLSETPKDARITWTNVPYAHHYYVIATDDLGARNIFLPGWSGLLWERADNMVGGFIHDEAHGRDPNRKYTYEVGYMYGSTIQKLPRRD